MLLGNQQRACQRHSLGLEQSLNLAQHGAIGQNKDIELLVRLVFRKKMLQRKIGDITSHGSRM